MVENIVFLLYEVTLGAFATARSATEENHFGNLVLDIQDLFLDLIQAEVIHGLHITLSIDGDDFSLLFVVVDDWLGGVLEGFEALFDGFGVVVRAATGLGTFQHTGFHDILLDVKVEKELHVTHPFHLGVPGIDVFLTAGEPIQEENALLLFQVNLENIHEEVRTDEFAGVLNLLDLGAKHGAGGHFRSQEISRRVVFEAHTFFE